MTATPVIVMDTISSLFVQESAAPTAKSPKAESIRVKIPGKIEVFSNTIFDPAALKPDVADELPDQWPATTV
jgi:hypothetical protein